MAKKDDGGWTPEQLAALEARSMAKILLSNRLPRCVFFPEPADEADSEGQLPPASFLFPQNGVK